MVKLDADGIAVVGWGIQQHVPTRPRQVCDVTGAGDMVLAVVGLCWAAGWGLVETAELANVAAGLEVRKFGVATVSWDGIQADVGTAACDVAGRGRPSPRTGRIRRSVAS